MKIVKFEDGNYGIVRWCWFSRSFLDIPDVLGDGRVNWRSGITPVNLYCKTNKERAIEAFNLVNHSMSYKVVKTNSGGDWV